MTKDDILDILKSIENVIAQLQNMYQQYSNALPKIEGKIEAYSDIYSSIKNKLAESETVEPEPTPEPPKKK